MKSTILKQLHRNAVFLFGLFVMFPVISMDDLNKSSLLIFEFPAPELKAAQQKDFGLQDYKQYDFTPADSDDAAASLLKKVQIPNLTVPNFSAYAVLGCLLSTKNSHANSDVSHDEAQDVHDFMKKYSLKIPAIQDIYASSKTVAKESKSNMMIFNNNMQNQVVTLPSISLATIWSVADKK